MGRHCTYSSDSKESCSAWAIKGSRYCFFHDPDKEEARKQARFRGGVLKPRMGDGPIRLESAKDVSGFVAELINGVRMRKVDKATASILSTLSQTLLRSLEVGDLEERLGQLESETEGKK